MKRPKRENYPNGIFGDMSYYSRLEIYTSYLENTIKQSKIGLEKCKGDKIIEEIYLYKKPQ